MISIYITHDKMYPLLAHELNQIMLPYNHYWIQKFDIENIGNVQEVRFATPGRGRVVSCMAKVKILRLGYRFQIEIIDIYNQRQLKWERQK